MRLGPGSLAVTAGISALLFLGALAIMSAIAGWSDVTGRLHLRLSFWFVIAFAAEAAAFAGYVFAYRSVATIEGGPGSAFVRQLLRTATSGTRTTSCG